MNQVTERPAITAPSGSAARQWVMAGIIVLVVFVAFAPALSAGFVTWDDDTNFLRNTEYRGLGLEQLKWMWTTHLLGHYVPLSWMSLGMDYSLWGMDPRGYHLTSLIIHAANALLLFFISRRLVRHALGPNAIEIDGPAAIAALIYAVHPLRAESVVWITERRDVLSSFFVLLAALAYLKAAAEPPFRRWYWVTLGAFIAAILSKATAVTLPVVLVVVSVYPLRLDRSRMLRELAPMFALSVAGGVSSLIALDPGPQLPLASKVAVSAYSVGFYFWKTLIPAGLAPLYEMPVHVRPLEFRYVVGYLITVVLLALTFGARRRLPAAAAAFVAAAVMILPLLGVVQNGVQIAADRYTYQAMQPIAVLVAGALALHWRRSLAFASATIIAILAVMSWRQSTYWIDSEALWNRVIEVDPNASLARTALANVLLAQNRLPEAVAQYQRSLAINPNSLEADNNLGMALTRLGRYDDAILHYQRAIEINPEHYEAHNNLGALIARRGDVTSAIDHFRRSLAIKPGFPDAEVNWGNALLRSGQPVEAVEHYARALATSPRAPGAQYNWGVALAQQRRFAEAVAHFRAALINDPADSAAAEALSSAERLARPGR